MEKIKFCCYALFLICLSFLLTHETQAQDKKEINLKLSGYKPQVLTGKISELKAYGTAFPLQSVEITPSNGISIKEIKECLPDPEVKSQNAIGVKVWSITIFIENTAQAGERSIVLETPQGKTEPKIILVATHFPVISNLQVKSDRTIEFTVFDKEGDFFDASGQVTVDYFTDYGRVFQAGTAHTSNYSIKDKKNIVVVVGLTTLEIKGACKLKISFEDKNGYKSNELETKIQF